jgi:transcriptional regulator with XRE-family HTH domain
MNPNVTIGKNIRYWRNAHDMSQAALAAKLGLSQPYLSQLEQGIKNPHVLTVARIAESLGLTVADLLDSPSRSAA